MGQYCCCHVKISGEDYEGKPQCTCDWDGWISLYDYPEDRKNKDIPFCEPVKDGEYLIRYQNQSADRHEKTSYFTLEPRKIYCGFTGRELVVHWSGDDEEQPYAWKEDNS